MARNTNCRLINMSNKRNSIMEKELGKAPRLLTLKKAAEYIGLTVWAMRERIWAGQIPVVRFPGGRKMYVDV